MPPPAKPMERITRKCIGDPLTGCWNWIGAGGNGDYGRLTVNYKKMLAHRQSYIDFVGHIPVGAHIDHLCMNKSCCNPEHLEAVSQQENNRRAGAMGRMDRRSHQTHCKFGHEYTTENTLITPEGWRSCRTCSREKMRAIREKKRLSNPVPVLTVRTR